LTRDDVGALLQRGRGPTTEFLLKRTSRLRLAETMAAMANSEGGAILLGVSPVSGTAQGVDDVDQVRDRVLQAALLCEPPLIIPVPEAATANDECDLLLIEIPRGLPHVYAVAGKYLKRVGTQNRPLSPRQLRRLWFERGEMSYEAQEVRGATFEDLNPDKIDSYLETVPALAALSPRESLLRRGCLTGRRGNHPTVHPRHTARASSSR